MKQILVLGIGSRLMMDDGIGVHVVEKLKSQNNNPNIDYIAGETDIDYCLDVIQGARFIVIIDAASTGRKPGDVTVFPLDELTREFNPGFSAHGLHLIDLVHYFHRDLKGILIGVEPAEIDCHPGLSDVLSARFPGIVNTVENILLKKIKLS